MVLCNVGRTGKREGKGREGGEERGEARARPRGVRKRRRDSWESMTTQLVLSGG